MSSPITLSAVTWLGMEDAKKVQERHLVNWKRILKAKVYERLVNECNAKNMRARSAHDILRGDTLTNQVIRIKNGL